MALAIAKNRIWPNLNYEPNGAQRKMHAAPARNRISAWGRRTGKSTAGGHELIPEAFKAYYNKQALEDKGIRQEYWIVGPNYTDSEKEFRVFHNDCKRLGLPMDRPGTYYDARSGNMQVSMWDGKFIVMAKSAAKPESLVGEGLHGVIMAEAAKMKESTWSKYVRPMLADFQGWSLFNSTPEGRNWFYDLWALGQDPARLEWWSAKFPSWANPHVYPGGATEAGLAILRTAIDSRVPITDAFIESTGVDLEIASLMQDLSTEMFAQEIGAEFGVYVGRVFKEWDEEVHVKDIAFDPKLPTYIATDYGWTNPNVALFIQADAWDNFYIVDEYYESGRDVNEFSSDLRGPRYRHLVNAAVRLYPDPASPADSNVLAKDLRLKVQGNTGGEVKERIELIRRVLKQQNMHLPWGHPDRRPTLLVDRKCTNVIREMDLYRYAETKNEERNNREDPMKKDDHTPEALGRFLRGYLGTPTGGGRPRSRQATYMAGPR